jgi:S1-C subfamily serine protease
MVNTRYLLLPALALCSGMAAAQFQWVFTSEPDSAEVKVNGTTRCHTPCAVNYRWRDQVDGRITVTVDAPGHVQWKDSVLEKPDRLMRSSQVKLDRNKINLDLGATSPVVAFDKLAADIPDGTTIGTYRDAKGKSEPIKWEGSVKVGDEAFQRSFYEILTNAGVRTPMREGAKLFSETVEGRQQLPRYMVGAQLLEYSIDLRHAEGKHYGAGAVTSRTRWLLEWQVLDRVSRKVVLSVRTEGVARYRQRSGAGKSENLRAFEDALLKFLAEGRFVELLQGTSTAPVPPVAEGEATRYPIKAVVNPAFKSMSEMIRHADRSCVTVITDGGHGSGVIINAEGYVLSAQHVVAGANGIEVMFSDGLRQQATVLASDAVNDLVLLDIAGSGYKPLPLAVEQPNMGDEVVTIGTPADLALGQSVSKGILSGKRMLEEREYLQTDVAVSPGNSGGPLLNERGEVIGIIQSKMMGKGIEGVGFAIPIQRVRELLRIDVAP